MVASQLTQYVGTHVTKLWFGMVLQKEREAKERAEEDLAAARRTSGQESQTSLEAYNLLQSKLEVT